MKLDKKQGYGHISGGHHGAVFEQNGRLFDAGGDEVFAPEEVVEQGEVAAGDAAVGQAAAPVAKKAAAVSHKKKVVAAPVTDKAPATPVDSQLAAQGL